MKARRDVPPYHSWVFPLQTLLEKMEAEPCSCHFFLLVLSFLPFFDGIPGARCFVLFCFFVQDVTDLCINSPSDDR